MADQFETEKLETILDHILSADEFSSSPRLTAFLRYIVRQKLQGNEEQIKAYTIAVDALGRPDTFDPQTDPTVRVLAGRLRKALHTYYESEGATDTIRIVVPKGSYIPSFVSHSLESDANIIGEDRHAGQSKLTRSISTRLPFFSSSTFVISILTLIILSGWILWHRSAPPSLSTSNPSTSVSPLSSNDRQSLQGVNTDIRPQLLRIFISPDAENDFKKVLLSSVTDILSRFKRYTVSLRSQKDDETYRAAPEDYQITINVMKHENHAVIEFQTIHLASGELIDSNKVNVNDTDWSQEKLTRLLPLQKTVASLLQDKGTIIADYTVRNNFTPVMACRIATIRYFEDETDEQHEYIRHCAEEAIKNGIEDANLYIVLAYIYGEEHEDLRNPREGSALERALGAAKKAVALGPSNAESHFVLMHAYALLGINDLMIKEGHFAITLNPFDATIQAAFGARLAFRGSFEEALKHLNRAEELDLSHPVWRHYGSFLAYYGLGQIDEAKERAIALSGSQHPPYIVALAIAAQHSGNLEEARRLKDLLQQHKIRNADDLRAIYQRRQYATQLINRLVRDVMAIK